MTMTLTRRQALNYAMVGTFITERYGIETPSGLANIPGTKLMAINGFHDGIALFDTSNMPIVQKFDTKNFGLKHLMFEAV
jgi:hypothetical protein